MDQALITSDSVSLVADPSKLGNQQPPLQLLFPPLGGAGILQAHDNTPIPPLASQPHLYSSGGPYRIDIRTNMGDNSSGVKPCFFKLGFPRYDGKEDQMRAIFSRTKDERTTQGLTGVIHMDGNAYHWYFHLERSCNKPPWDEFKTLCNTRFGPPIRSDPLGKLRHLRQTGIFEDYQSRSLALLSRADPMMEHREHQLFTSTLQWMWSTKIRLT